jgi:ketosteroid isomerase-like protein
MAEARALSTNKESPMDRAAVQDWLDRYVAAWQSYDRAAIGDLFAADATYRYHPHDEGDDVVRGRDAIVSSWVEPEGSASERDEPGTYDAKYEAYAVDGDRAVAVGWSRYFKDASQSTVERTYDNVFLMRFDDDGRCKEFTELFMERK